MTIQIKQPKSDLTRLFAACALSALATGCAITPSTNTSSSEANTDKFQQILQQRVDAAHQWDEMVKQAADMNLHVSVFDAACKGAATDVKKQATCATVLRQFSWRYANKEVPPNTALWILEGNIVNTQAAEGKQSYCLIDEGLPYCADYPLVQITAASGVVKPAVSTASHAINKIAAPKVVAAQALPKEKSAKPVVAVEKPVVVANDNTGTVVEWLVNKQVVDAQRFVVPTLSLLNPTPVRSVVERPVAANKDLSALVDEIAIQPVVDAQNYLAQMLPMHWPTWSVAKKSADLYTDLSSLVAGVWNQQVLDVQDEVLGTQNYVAMFSPLAKVYPAKPVAAPAVDNSAPLPSLLSELVQKPVFDARSYVAQMFSSPKAVLEEKAIVNPEGSAEVSRARSQGITGFILSSPLLLAAAAFVGLRKKQPAGQSKKEKTPLHEDERSVHAHDPEFDPAHTEPGDFHEIEVDHSGDHAVHVGDVDFAPAHAEFGEIDPEHLDTHIIPVDGVELEPDHAEFGDVHEIDVGVANEHLFVVGSEFDQHGDAAGENDTFGVKDVEVMALFMDSSEPLAVVPEAVVVAVNSGNSQQDKSSAAQLKDAWSKARKVFAEWNKADAANKASATVGVQQALASMQTVIPALFETDASTAFKAARYVLNKEVVFGDAQKQDQLLSLLKANINRIADDKLLAQAQNYIKKMEKTFAKRPVQVASASGSALTA